MEPHLRRSLGQGGEEGAAVETAACQPRSHAATRCVPLVGRRGRPARRHPRDAGARCGPAPPPASRPAAGGPFEDGPEPSRPLRTSVEEGTPVLEAQPCCCVPREAASLWPTPDRGEELLLRNEAWPGVQGCLRGAAPRLRSREGACLRAPAPQAPAPLPTERTPTSGSWASVLGSGPRPAGPRWAGNTAGGHVLTPGPLHILSLRPRFRFPRHPAASSFLLPARPQACHLLREGPPLPSSPRCSPASVHRLHF